MLKVGHRKCRKLKIHRKCRKYSLVKQLVYLSSAVHTYLHRPGHCQSDVLVLLQEKQHSLLWVVDFKPIHLEIREETKGHYQLAHWLSSASTYTLSSAP